MIEHNTIMSSHTWKLKSFLSLAKSYTMIQPEITNDVIIELTESVKKPSNYDPKLVDDIISNFCQTDLSNKLINQFIRLTDRNLYNFTVDSLENLKFGKSRFMSVPISVHTELGGFENKILLSLISTKPSYIGDCLLLQGHKRVTRDGINLSEILNLSIAYHGGKDYLYDKDVSNASLSVIPKTGGKGRVIAKFNA